MDFSKRRFPGNYLVRTQSGCSRRTLGAVIAAMPILFLRAGPGPLLPTGGDLALTAQPDGSRSESSTTVTKRLHEK